MICEIEDKAAISNTKYSCTTSLLIVVPFSRLWIGKILFVKLQDSRPVENGEKRCPFLEDVMY